MSDNVTYYLLASSVQRSALHGSDAHDHKFDGNAYRLLAVWSDRPPQIVWYLDDPLKEAAEDLRYEDGTPYALWSWGLNAIVGQSAHAAEKLARAAIERLRDAGHTHNHFGGWVR